MTKAKNDEGSYDIQMGRTYLAKESELVSRKTKGISADQLDSTIGKFKGFTDIPNFTHTLRKKGR